MSIFNFFAVFLQQKTLPNDSTGLSFLVIDLPLYYRRHQADDEKSDLH